MKGVYPVEKKESVRENQLAYFPVLASIYRVPNRALIPRYAVTGVNSVLRRIEQDPACCPVRIAVPHLNPTGRPFVACPQCRVGMASKALGVTHHPRVLTIDGPQVEVS